MVAKSLLLEVPHLVVSLAQTSPLTTNPGAPWLDCCVSVISPGEKELDLIQLFFPVEDKEGEMGINDPGRCLCHSHFDRHSNLDIIQMTSVQARSSLKHEPLARLSYLGGRCPGKCVKAWRASSGEQGQ